MVASNTNATTFNTMPNASARRDDLALGERAGERAPHELVAVALDPAVDGVGAAGRHRPADHDRRDQPERRPALLGEHHGRHRGDEQQLDDAGLRQADVRAQRRRERTADFERERGLDHVAGARRVGDGRHPTSILPFIPAAAWPGTVQSKSYVPLESVTVPESVLPLFVLSSRFASGIFNVW